MPQARRLKKTHKVTNSQCKIRKKLIMGNRNELTKLSKSMNKYELNQVNLE